MLEPPPPPQEPADLPPDSSPDALDADEKKNNPWLFWGPLLTAIGLALLPIAVLALPLLLIALLKSRRRKVRFSEGPPAQRVGGGWNEVVSLATDLGAGVDSRATRRESAVVLAGAFPAAGGTTTLLANRADAAIFGAGQPSEDQVRQYWETVDGSLKEMTGTLGFWGRQRARFSPRSLLADGRAALKLRGLQPARTGQPGRKRAAPAGPEKPAGTVESGPPAAAPLDTAGTPADPSQTVRKNRNTP